MDFGGRLPADAPDPRLRLADQAREMPVPVMGLVPQPSLGDTDMLGVSAGHDASGLADMTVDVSYTLWRNPDDRSDPVNLAVLDDRLREATERTTPWPRPAWLVEHIERMRYPQLWDAVRTTWTRRASGVDLLDALADHLDEVLTNRYQDAAARRHPFDPPPVPRSVVERAAIGAMIEVNGVATDAVEFDAHPLFRAVGVQLGPSTVATVVLPRAELSYVEVALVTRSQPGA